MLRKRRALILLTEATVSQNEKLIEVALKRAYSAHLPSWHQKIKEAERVLKMLYAKFTEYDALLAFLDLGYQNGAMKLVRGSWLADPNHIRRLIRQQELALNSFWQPSELRSQLNVVSIVALSYSWLHPVNPDPP